MVPFPRDLALLTDITLERDTAMKAVPRALREEALQDCGAASTSDQFLLSAMRALALAGNGHTRLIPNAAIKVRPCRFVWAGDGPWLVNCLEPMRLIHVNGAAVPEIFERLRPFLAGTLARQQAIGGICLGWPAALEALGLGNGPTTYRFDFTERSESALVPAEPIYPRFESGFPIPDTDPFAQSKDSLRLPSFAVDPATVLPGALEHVARHRLGPLILDLRGNQGGSFLNFLPLLNALSDEWSGPQISLLVDKFTFSAAIVFVALLKHRLGGKARIIGETMGDGLVFHAEGDTATCPETGAHIRFSDGFHDWKTGKPGPDTPPEIAEHMRACGSLEPDILSVTTPLDLAEGRDPTLALATKL